MVFHFKGARQGDYLTSRFVELTAVNILSRLLRLGSNVTTGERWGARVPSLLDIS